MTYYEEQPGEAGQERIEWALQTDPVDIWAELEDIKAASGIDTLPVGSARESLPTRVRAFGGMVLHASLEGLEPLQKFFMPPTGRRA